MRLTDAAIPAGMLWSSPFARWQGVLAEVSGLDLAEAVTCRATADRRIDAQELELTRPGRVGAAARDLLRRTLARSAHRSRTCHRRHGQPGLANPGGRSSGGPPPRWRDNPFAVNNPYFAQQTAFPLDRTTDRTGSGTRGPRPAYGRSPSWSRSSGFAAADRAVHWVRGRRHWHGAGGGSHRLTQEVWARGRRLRHPLGAGT